LPEILSTPRTLGGIQTIVQTSSSSLGNHPHFPFQRKEEGQLFGSI